MGFGIFMLIMDLIIPFTLIGFGRYFMKKVPKKINGVFGYRTAMSMKNEDTWAFAHHYCGRIWYICGLVTLPITVIVMFFVIGKNVDVIGAAGGIVVGVQIVLFIVAVFLTERALKKNFDENGRRR